MSAWTPALCAAFERDVIAPRVSLIVRPGDAVHAVITGAARVALGGIPAAARGVVGAALRPVEERLAGVSVTVPTFLPGVLPAMVLSPAAMAGPVACTSTQAHEAVHAGQIVRAGDWQAVADYTSGELRAQREADAAAAGRVMRHWLTGDGLDAAPLSGLYCLDAGDAALAVGLLRSHVETARAGLVPPIDVCIAAARWLRSAPDVPDEIRARVPEVA